MNIGKKFFMKKLYSVVLAMLTILLFTACGNTADKSSSSDQKPSTTSAATHSESSEQEQATTEKGRGKRILVAYFSRTGENYAVGNIAKGNTHIIADMIAEATGADTFEIKTVTPYPESYKECTEVAKKELADNARPKLAAKIKNMNDYDVIFLGYPIWWSDMPMAIYSFMESYNFNGKTIIPFSTSAGDVLTGKETTIPKYAKGAKVLPGIGIEGKRAQLNPNSVRPEVQKWLMQLGFVE